MNLMTQTEVIREVARLAAETEDQDLVMAAWERVLGRQVMNVWDLDGPPLPDDLLVTDLMTSLRLFIAEVKGER